MLLANSIVINGPILKNNLTIWSHCCQPSFWAEKSLKNKILSNCLYSNSHFKVGHSFVAGEKYSLETCFFPSPALIPAADAAFVQISFFNRKRLRKNYERFANKVFHMVQQHSNENCRTQVDQKYFLSTCLSAISIDCTGCWPNTFCPFTTLIFSYSCYPYIHYTNLKSWWLEICLKYDTVVVRSKSVYKIGHRMFGSLYKNVYLKKFSNFGQPRPNFFYFQFSQFNDKLIRQLEVVSDQINLLKSWKSVDAWIQ